MVNKENTQYRFKTIRRKRSSHDVETIDRGFIKSTDPMAALEELVNLYPVRSDLFTVEIIRQESRYKVLARYLSARAATQETAPHGKVEWREDVLYVDGNKIPEKEEVFRNLL